MKPTNEIPTIKDIVLKFLIEDPDTRDSDGLLISRVYETLNPAVKNMKALYVLEHIADLKLCQMESIRRARQDIQRDWPELKGSHAVTKFRMEKEKTIKEYLRNER